MGKIADHELQEALDKIEDLWHNCRSLIEFCYARVDANSRTILPGEQRKPALVVPLDYDAVVPVLKPREPFPSLVRMFEARLPVMAQTCAQLLPVAQMCEAAQEPGDDISPYWNNSYFTGMDARIAYALARSRAPRRILEIGSGNSTRFFRKAINDGKFPTQLVSIDPSPRLEITKVADEIIPRSVTEVTLDYFAGLSAGDILFFDGSHLCFHGSDVCHFFLRILPEVPRGVIVHVHDIFLPDEYPEHFDIRYYNEQYMMAAFLMHNTEWTVTLPVHYLHQQRVLDGDGGSFWIERTGTGNLA